MIQGIIKSYFATWLNIFNFWGRATKKDVWIFSIVTSLLLFFIAFVLAILDVKFGIRHNPYAPLSFKIFGYTFLKNMVFKDFVEWIFIICFLTLGIRRMHDTGQTAATWFWFLIPIVGQFYLFFVLFFEPSNNNKESMGLNPYSHASQQTKI